MRIGELARRSGVPVPTIKYYLREGLLPPGERTSPNQVRYAETHVRRLRLIRALMEVGGLSVAAAGDVLTEVDSPHRSVHGVLGVVQSAVTRESGRLEDPDERERAERDVAELVRRHGWAVKSSNPGWATLVQLVLTYRGLDRDDLLVLLDEYAQAAARLAVAELETLALARDTDAKAEGVVLGTVLGDAAMAALRRIAQEDVSARSQGTLRAG